MIEVLVKSIYKIVTELYLIQIIFTAIKVFRETIIRNRIGIYRKLNMKKASKLHFIAY